MRGKQNFASALGFQKENWGFSEIIKLQFEKNKNNENKHAIHRFVIFCFLE